MTVPQRGSEVVKLDGGSLGLLTFSWQDDRYHHSWSFPTEGSIDPSQNIDNNEPIIRSLESSSEEHWPESPPLQQIHSQSFGDGREVIFGVGMAGRGHWSASFTLVPDLKCWIVELACKCPTEPERLLSSYQLQGQDRSENPLQGHEFCVSSDMGIVLEAIAPGTNATIPSSSSVCFAPRSLSTVGTIQWAFRLRVGS